MFAYHKMQNKTLIEYNIIYNNYETIFDRNIVSISNNYGNNKRINIQKLINKKTESTSRYTKHKMTVSVKKKTDLSLAKEERSQ